MEATARPEAVAGDVPVLRDRCQGERLRRLLGDAGFDEAGLCRLFSVRSLRALPERPAPVLQRCMSGPSALSCLARWFLLEQPVGQRQARAALGPAALATLQATGLVRFAEPTTIGTCSARRHDGCADFVLEPGPSSRWVAANAIRRPVGSTLDLGSGSGYLACLAAAHSERVTATDVSPRARDFARFNAALNGLDQVECLCGDLYAPLGRRRFDHIVCNGPFVPQSWESGRRFVLARRADW